MKRELPIVGGAVIFVVLVAVFALSNNSSSTLSLAEKDSIPVAAILGASIPQETVNSTPTSLPTISITPTPSLTITMTPPPTKTPTVIPTTTPTPGITQQISCNSMYTELKRIATEFMNAHKKKDLALTLSYISRPTSEPDKDSLDFLLENLYETATTSYTTVSYSIGTVEDKGKDLKNGSIQCQITVYEVREQNVAGDQPTYTAKTYLRYIDFAVDASKFTKLTAFRDDTDNGTKYSGFN